MTIFDELAIWIKAQAGVHNVSTGQLRWSKQDYPAVRYFRTLDTLPGCRAYAEGERQHTQEFIYAIGMLPKSYCRSSHVALTTLADVREWYVCCYAGHITNRMQAIQDVDDYHPFGNSFMLSPWQVPDGTAIDTYERMPYRREAIEFRN